MVAAQTIVHTLFHIGSARVTLDPGQVNEAWQTEQERGDDVLESAPPNWRQSTRLHEHRTCSHASAWPHLGLLPNMVGTMANSQVLSMLKPTVASVRKGQGGFTFKPKPKLTAGG
jgi:hypothetical protein